MLYLEIKGKDEVEYWSGISERAILEVVTLKHVLKTLIDLLEDKGMVTLDEVNAAMSMTMVEREEILREMLK